MRASERRDLFKLYLDRYLENGDENLFHGMIDSGGQFVEELSFRFEAERSVSAKLSIICIAREIRTKESEDFLVRASLSQTKRIWEAALEGLAYQQLYDVLNRLRELSADILEPGDVEKRQYIDRLIRFAPEWLVQ